MRCGFTLIELLVVIAIIGILMAILLPVTNRAHGHARCHLRFQPAADRPGADLILQRSQEPARPNPLRFASPHMLRYQDQDVSVAELMEQYAGSRRVLYSPVVSTNTGNPGCAAFCTTSGNGESKGLIAASRTADKHKTPELLRKYFAPLRRFSRY